MGWLKLLNLCRKSSGLRRCITSPEGGLYLLLLFAWGYIHQLPARCPTPLSRLDLLHAFVSSGTLRIDHYQNNTPDKAEFDGHFYSDKAPGTALLAVPAFVVSTLGFRAAGKDLDSASGWLISSWVACVGSIGVLTALGAGLMLNWLSAWVSRRQALVTTLGIFLGAAPLPYATMMFSHALVVGLLAIAIWAMAREETQNPAMNSASRPSLAALHSFWPWAYTMRWDLLSGFSCGLALASEYTAGVVVVALFLCLMTRPRGPGSPPAERCGMRLSAFGLAAVPPLLLIPLYSWQCFGTPFILPYSLNPSFPEMKEGIFAIKYPDAQTAYDLLFSPTRGLIFWSPVLAMSAVGYWRLLRKNQALFWIMYVAPALHVVVISGRTWDWQAGPSLGPRYLAPILPLLALPCALGIERFPRIGMVLAGYSIAITTAATLTDACPSASYYNPLTELHLPSLLKGEISPNIGTVIGLRPCASVAVFYVILSVGIAWLWQRCHDEPKNNGAAVGATISNMRSRAPI